MISKKQMMIALCIMMQSSVFAVLDKATNAILDWDARIAQARELTTQMKMSSGEKKKQLQSDLADYCNSKFGFHGRLLNQYLTEDQKRQVYTFCGEAMKDKNPRAYEAVQEAGQLKANLKKKYEDLKSSSKDFSSNATALKEKMKAEAEKPWYKW